MENFSLLVKPSSRVYHHRCGTPIHDQVVNYVARQADVHRISSDQGCEILSSGQSTLDYTHSRRLLILLTIISQSGNKVDNTLWGEIFVSS